MATFLADARERIAALERAATRLERTDAGRCGGCGDATRYERLVTRPMTDRRVRCAVEPRHRT